MAKKGSRPKIKITLTPEQREHQRHHHRQGQEPGAQAQFMEVDQLGQGGWVDQCGEMLRHLLIGRGHGRPFAPVALDGASVSDGTAFLGFGIGGRGRFHTPVLSSPGDSATPLTRSPNP